MEPRSILSTLRFGLAPRPIQPPPPEDAAAWLKA
jgi:hypothetical protein